MRKQNPGRTDGLINRKRTVPALSIDEVWATLKPFFDTLLTSNARDLQMWSQAHTTAFNYLTTVPQATEGPDGNRSANLIGMKLYSRVQDYFSVHAQTCLVEINANANANASEEEGEVDALVRMLLRVFARYSRGVKSINRVLDTLNRYWVKREGDENKGWPMVPNTDLDPDPDRGFPMGEQHLQVRMQEKKREELESVWGCKYDQEGKALDSEEEQRVTESAQAASPLDRIVPVSAVAYRQFRLQVVEPLMEVGNNDSEGTTGRARLVHATDEWLQRERDDSEKEGGFTRRDFGELLRLCGVYPTHELRRMVGDERVKV